MPNSPKGPGSRKGMAVAAVYLGTFMATLAISIVTVALPAIQAGLSTDLAGLQWVVGSYALCLSAFMLSQAPSATAMAASARGSVAWRCS